MRSLLCVVLGWNFLAAALVAEPLVFAETLMTQGPLAVCVDEKNRLYVFEASPLQGYRVVRLVDRNHDGVADFQTVYADGFEELLGKDAPSMTAIGHEVFVSTAEKVWQCVDRDEDGIAEKRGLFVEGTGAVIGGIDGWFYWIEGSQIRCCPLGHPDKSRIFAEVKGGRLRDLVIGIDGGIYAISTKSLLKISRGKTVEIGQFEQAVRGLAVDPFSGELVACRAGGGLERVTVVGDVVVQRSLIDSEWKGNDLAFGADGELYISCVERILMLRSPKVTDAREILSKGFRYVDKDQLGEWLRDAHFHVRLGARREWIRRGHQAPDYWAGEDE